MKKIAEINDIFEVPMEFVLDNFIRAIKYFKNKDKFYIRMCDYKKSSYCLYVFELLEIEEDLIEGKRFRLNYCKLFRDELLKYLPMMRKLKKEEITMLYLYSNISARSDRVY